MEITEEYNTDAENAEILKLTLFRLHQARRQISNHDDPIIVNEICDPIEELIEKFTIDHREVIKS